MKEHEQEINWRRMADLDNWLRHAYHRINVDLLWTIANEDLPPLRAFVERVIKGEKNR